MIVRNRPFRFCYSVARQELTNRAQLSGSELAADTLPLRTQMKISLIRIIVADAMNPCFTSRNAGKILTCIVCVIAHNQSMNQSTYINQKLTYVNRLKELVCLTIQLSVDVLQRYVLYIPNYIADGFCCVRRGINFYLYSLYISSLLCSAEHSRIHAKE